MRYRYLFGECKNKWVDAYFPFTNPSFELETEFNSTSLEMLGSGIIHDGVMKNAGKDPTQECGWAFGMGVERWTMKLFGIPDIKLFWSDNQRFLRQFKKGEVTKFIDYGKNPSCYRDVSFWIPEGLDFSDNELFEIAREVAGDMVEYIKCIDVFKNPKNNQTSKCYRFSYCHRDKCLASSEVDVFHNEIRKKLANILHVTLR